MESVWVLVASLASADERQCAPVGLRAGPHGTGRYGNQLLAIGRAATIADALNVSLTVPTYNRAARGHVLTSPLVCIDPSRRFPVPLAEPTRLDLNLAFDGPWHQPDGCMATPELSRADNANLPGCPGFACQDIVSCGGPPYYARKQGRNRGDSHSVLRFRHAMVTHVLPVLFAQPQQLADQDTLILHIRSGDAMVDSRGYHPPQPPLAIYKRVISTYHDTDPVIICTERGSAVADGKAGGNPVVGALLRWRPNQIRLSGSNPSAAHDAAVILGARYLFAGPSSFSMTLASAAPFLRRLYINGPGIFPTDTVAAPLGWPPTGNSSGGTTLVDVRDQTYAPVAGNVSATFERMLKYKPPPEFSFKEYPPVLDAARYRLKFTHQR